MKYKCESILHRHSPQNATFGTNFYSDIFMKPNKLMDLSAEMKTTIKPEIPKSVHEIT